ncbi:lipoate--protein ligase A [Synechococcus sp. PCC 6312]|uniref:lipoyl protein ligase domain-containing protein n=1 Tax=Synechococcus sp. (strain ATCC 27167 / PCC 6312) TaxID=195253 RepID=UPI00029EF482|nr:lipoate--protein ligase A [Synechococcus sp. PCC 6312]AFY60442.1 lipoate-protein ligase A [Synechococcus sp. PCC 6312]
MTVNISHPVWRYIPPITATGLTQMAIDTWLWQQQQQGGMTSCLRFYQWESAAISYGYHQKDLPAQWCTLAWGGKPLEIIKRPTGGRAVLHQGDLTYGIVTRMAAPRRRLAYETLCQFLITGWGRLGLPLRLGSDLGHDQRTVNCFSRATTADLVLPCPLSGGYKLIGSAQAWSGLTVLQQGSMRLWPDPNLWQQVFQAPLILPNCQFPDTEIIISTLCQALEDDLGISLVSEPLTPAEWQAIKKIQNDPQFTCSN